MLSSYRDILSIPGAWRFSLAGLIARFPMSIVGISQILMIRTLYGEYALAGQVSAANVIAYALCAPTLGRLVDRHGQSRVMTPAITVAALGMLGVIVAAILHAPPVWLYVFTVISGATSGSLGSMVRSRWSQVVTTPAQLHTAFSMESTLDEFVYMVGPVIATTVTTSVHPVAGLILAITFIVTGGYWFLAQKDTEPPASGRLSSADNSTGHSSRHQGSLMRLPVMVALAVVYILAGAMFGGIDMSVVAFTAEHSQPATSGVVLGIFAGGSMVAGLLYGTRTWRFALWKLFIAGVILLAFGATAIAFASTIVGMSIVVFITGFTISPTMINVNTMVQHAVPQMRLTEGLTQMSTAMAIGVSLGSAVTGRIADHAGSRGGFGIVIAFAWMMVVVTVIAIPVLRKTSEHSVHIDFESRD